MINIDDQTQLFNLISNYLEKSMSCIAIGGTAMMFLGYKNTTKDIDLVFSSTKDRNMFIKAIKQLGYQEKSLINIYDKKRQENNSKPKMFSRGEERFDLFVKNVFGFELKINDNFIQRIDFLGKSELNIFILPEEYLILLKSITNRAKDFEDIETIAQIKKDIDWGLIVDQAALQRKRVDWILIDLEKTMQKLKSKFFIKKKYFDRIYKAEEKCS